MTQNPEQGGSHTPGTLPWRCFQCDEVFTEERCARLHFGREEGATPACALKGADGGLLKALRDAEEQADDAIQMMHAESTDAAKAYHSQRCRHTQALISAEEAGYERGMDDMREQNAELLEALADFCLAAEYWAGCDEDVSPDDASSEIMGSGGAWPAQAYDKARTLLAKARPEPSQPPYEEN
jgi:hypothetical protein